MCLFSRRVRHVSKTRIFARALPQNRQFLAYSMNVALDGDTAMILPLPVARAAGASGATEDALRFVDMSSAPSFFDDLDALFPSERVLHRGVAAAPAPAARANLAVHDVGEFEASFVPSIDDFDRLDPRFRLPRDLWNALPAYRDHAFAVFKLKSPPARTTATSRPIHPMAFEFERRDPDTLFFPTVHITTARFTRRRTSITRFMRNSNRVAKHSATGGDPKASVRTCENRRGDSSTHRARCSASR